MKQILAILAITAASLWAGPQDIHFPASLDALAGKAEEVVDITLDADMLGFAGAFMSDQDRDEKTAKDLVKTLKGVYIRSYQFKEEGQYSPDDLDEVRSQLKKPEWVPVVNVRSKTGGDNAQIYFKKENGKISGITILAAEPTELTIVHIVGSIDPADVAKLGGNFGIPNMSMGPAEEDGEQ